LDQRKKDIAQKFLTGAENDEDLKQEIQDLLAQFSSDAASNAIVKQAEEQKASQEERLKEKIRLRKEKLERERLKEVQKINKDLNEIDIENVTELEQAIDEAFVKKKLKEAIAKRFGSRSPSPNQSMDTSMADLTKDEQPESKQIDQNALNAEEEAKRKQEAKQRLFDITKNLDTALE
jgi:hypothetical protein